MHTWDRAPLKFTSCLNLTIQIFTWREKHVLQRTLSHRSHMVEA